MRHKDIWTAIDKLAKMNGLTASGLAKKAGLDSTAFNPSKRTSKDGRPRWLTTESIARVLKVVGMEFDEFAALVEGKSGPTAPLLGLAQAGNDGYFDASGFPVGEGWEQIDIPGREKGAVYALEITGDSMEPAYRKGDKIIVSPGAEVNRGDRIVARTVEGEVMAKVLHKKNQRAIELASLNPDYPVRSFKPSEIKWMARILWASQ